MTRPDRLDVTLGVYDQDVQVVTEVQSNFAPLRPIRVKTRQVPNGLRYRLVRAVALITPPVHNPTFLPDFRLYKGSHTSGSIVCAVRENGAGTYNQLYESGPLSVILNQGDFLTFAWGEEVDVDSGCTLIGTAVFDMIPINRR